MTNPPERMANRVSEDPFFLAAPLRCYAQSNELDDAALAEQLGCPVGTLTNLRLCRNPKPEPPHFWQEVETIAKRFGLNPDTLANVVRIGQSFLTLQSSATAEHTQDSAGFLLAARDDEEEPSDTDVDT